MALRAKTVKRVATRAGKETSPKVISRQYLSPLGKSEIGVDRIRDAVKSVRADRRVKVGELKAHAKKAAKAI